MEKYIFTLLSQKGFFIEEYSVLGRDKREYIAMYFSGTKVLAVILSTEDNYEIKAMSGLNHLRAKGFSEIYFNNIIITDNINIHSENYGTILLSKNGKDVIGYNNANGEIINILKESNSKGSIKIEKPIKEFLTPTNIIIGINILVFLITAYYSRSLSYINNNVLVFFGAKVNFLIDRGEYYRLFTAMFLHGGLVHIGFNMYALKSLGELIEKIYGNKKFLAIYFIGGLTGSYFSYIFSDSISVGASGAIFALLGGALIYAHKEKGRIGKDFFIEILKVIGINIFIGLTLPNIDNYGHLGGLIGGAIVAYILYSRRRKI
ncbi:rhomboid family intramembrane serine protease [Clostridium sp.]|uniref:rhomboid family intramembrane serine protease n=1 Tax=Clostridium sp. TaxID=1506 RepID=UPI0034644507